MPYTPRPIVELPQKPIDTTYSKNEIESIVKTNKIVEETVVSINAVDSTLSTQTPTYVEVENFTDSSIVTVVYDTPNSNSRILTIYNTNTKIARVIDYTKVGKDIVAHKIVETVRGNKKRVYTDHVAEIKKTEEFKTVMTAAKSLVRSVQEQYITGVETTIKSSSTQYTIVAVEKGVIHQAVLQYNPETKHVVLVGEEETSIVTEINKITKKSEHKAVKISLETIQSKEITDISSTVVSTNPQIFDEQTTIVSGAVS